MQVVEPQAVFAEELEMLARDRTSARASAGPDSVHSACDDGVEGVETLIQLGRPVAPEAHPFAVGAVVEVVAHHII